MNSHLSNANTRVKSQMSQLFSTGNAAINATIPAHLRSQLHIRSEGIVESDVRLICLYISWPETGLDIAVNSAFGDGGVKIDVKNSCEHFANVPGIPPIGFVRTHLEEILTKHLSEQL